MTNQQQFLNLIGIANRAGKVVTGSDIILNAIKKRQISFLVIASDTGKSTTKKFIDKAHSYQIDYDDSITKQALSDAIGKPRTMVGIADRGFANKLREIKSN
ncbi:L7Ae/L30e/S12e/Gadd45 family ribosomal protein [Nicoliella lavandulae]|uniref:Ribosomal L7Ae/L30e/S12e/Gadd45 family protein n=1 Tax=Nicoliella lavandulae TaxID=3082954 RepID=A0ABU8SMC6_9LACO